MFTSGSKEYRYLFSESMKDGHVDSLINKAVLYGASGTGKSSFMDFVVDNPPQDIRRSTPLTARPVSLFQVDTNDQEWKKLSALQRKEMLAKAMASVKPAPNTDENVISDDDRDEEQTPSQVNTKALTTEHMSSTHEPDPSFQPVVMPEASPRVKTYNTSQPDKRTLLKSIATCGDLVQLVGQYSKTGEVVTSYRKIIFVDSGGQPQFHEMLPVFLRRMTLYIFVFKLSEELATKPVVEYYNGSGEVVGKPYQSAQTNEQLLQHCLRILSTHRTTSRSKEKSSRIMIVGTHRDLESECTETRADKNKKLASLLLPTFKDEVTYSNLAENEFIFAVNAKDRQPEDIAFAKKFQRLVLTEFSPDPVKIPLRYYCLEIILEEASQALGRGVLSIDECLEAAAELHFNKHTLGAALEFLDGISVIFYFPEVLEGVVFTDPQVLLDKATEPVEKIYSLRKGTCSSDAIVSGEWQEFKEHALFTRSFLDQDAFQKHYVAGLFTPSRAHQALQKASDSG
jgi:GTPase SAR1 family protein